MKIKSMNRKMGQLRDGSYWALRVSHRKAHGKVGPRFLVRCGCCDQRVEIYYDDESLEIGGVLGSIGNWREILEPLLAGRAPDKPPPGSAGR